MRLLSRGESAHLKHPQEAGINQGIAIQVTEVSGTEGYLYPAAIYCARERTGPSADKAQSASAPRQTQKAIPEIPRKPAEPHPGPRWNCPDTEQWGPQRGQSCFFSPFSDQTSRRWQGRGRTFGGHLLDLPRGRGSRSHIPVRGTEFADKNTARVMLGMEQAGSSCRRLHNIPLLARLQSTKTKQKFSWHLCGLKRVFLFSQQLLNKRFDPCAAAPVPAFSPESCAGRVEKMLKVMGVP